MKVYMKLYNCSRWVSSNENSQPMFKVRIKKKIYLDKYVCALLFKAIVKPNKIHFQTMEFTRFFTFIVQVWRYLLSNGNKMAAVLQYWPNCRMHKLSVFLVDIQHSAQEE